MKKNLEEKQFEVIVSPTDTLEKELEEILGRNDFCDPICSFCNSISSPISGKNVLMDLSGMVMTAFQKNNIFRNSRMN